MNTDDDNPVPMVSDIAEVTDRVHAVARHVRATAPELERPGGGG